MNTWELCQQLANYWREWFGLPTQGAVFPAYESINQAQDQACIHADLNTRTYDHPTGGSYGTSDPNPHFAVGMASPQLD